MKSVRIQPINSETVLIDVVCGCGTNCLENMSTHERTPKHEITVDSHDTVLECPGCSARFLVHPQRDHIHVTELND